MSLDESSVSLDSSVSSVQIDEVDSVNNSNGSSDQNFIISKNAFFTRENSSIKLYILKSLSSMILYSINSFRISHNKSYILEDQDLFAIAMDHSHLMSQGQDNFKTDSLKQKMCQYSFVCYEAHISRHPNDENALTSVVNTWTSEPSIMKSILSDFNVAAVGTQISYETNETFFTLILALRSIIGNSFYKGNSLRSMILAEKTINLLNDIRTSHFSLPPIKMDIKLCESAFNFCKMNQLSITPDFLKEKCGIFSSQKIAFGKIKINKHKKNSIIPEEIVEEWLNQIGRSHLYLSSEFNRIGVGFEICKDSTLKSLIIFIRSIQASLVDGTESTIGEAIIAENICNSLNKFREQHGLNPLNYDEDLCEIAERHSVYVANGKFGEDPLDEDDYTQIVEPRYSAIDVSHMVICEMSRVPSVYMSKWRKNEGCLSVILNHTVEDIGVGVAFDENFMCHITTILAANEEYDNRKEIVNKIVRF